MGEIVTGKRGTPEVWHRARGVANCKRRVDILPRAAANCPTGSAEVWHRDRRLFGGFGLFAIPTTPLICMEREGQFGGVW
jgi:hypothetical protein